MTHSHLKTVAVANEMVFLGAIVVPEHLFIQIAEQVKRLDVDVCPLESALEQAPEVIQSLVRQKSVGIDRALRFDVSANFGLQVVLPASGNNVGVNLPATFQNTHNGSLALNSTVGDFLAALVGMHETGSTADEGFVHFDFLASPAELHKLLLMQSETDAVHHKPSGLLSDAESTGNLIGTNSVLGV